MYPFSTILLLLFNVLSGLVSCYYYIKVSNITELHSIFEIASYIIGGRAVILFFSFVYFIMYCYETATRFALQDLFIYFFTEMISIDDGTKSNFEDSWSFILFLFLFNFLLFPLCLYKDLYKFKNFAVVSLVMSVLLTTSIYLVIVALDRNEDI